MFVGWKWTSSQKEIIICMVRVSLQSYCPLDGSAPIQCEIEAAFSWKSCLSPAWLFSSKKRFLYLWCELIWGFYLIQVYNYITQLYVEYTVTSNDSISSTFRRLSTKCILPIVFGATHTCLAQQWHAGPDRQQGLDSYRPQHDHICKKRGWKIFKHEEYINIHK